MEPAAKVAEPPTLVKTGDEYSESAITLTWTAATRNMDGSTPVNLLEHDGRRYLVSARGHGQWVRNLRAAGAGELRVGRRTEAFAGRELTDEEKVPVLRAYLKRWKAEVGVFFGGVGPDSSDEQLRAIAPDHPAFEVLPMA